MITIRNFSSTKLFSCRRSDVWVIHVQFDIVKSQKWTYDGGGLYQKVDQDTAGWGLVPMSCSCCRTCSISETTGVDPESWNSPRSKSAA